MMSKKKNEYCVLTLSKIDEHLNRLLSTLQVAQSDLAMENIFVVDDGLSKSIKEKWKVNYIPGKQPFSFSKNFNIGIAATPKQKDVFFIGDDGVVVTPKGIERLAEAAYLEPKIGMAGPAVIGTTNNPFQELGVLYKKTKASELKDKEGYQYAMIFIAVYIKREVLNVVGPISEKLEGYGYEDNYFSKKMMAAGYDWIIDPEIIVSHGWEDLSGSATYTKVGIDQKERVKQMEINRKILDEL